MLLTTSKPEDNELKKSYYLLEDFKSQKVYLSILLTFLFESR